MRAALVPGAERGRGEVRARDTSDTRQPKIYDTDCLDGTTLSKAGRKYLLNEQETCNNPKIEEATQTFQSILIDC